MRQSFTANGVDDQIVIRQLVLEFLGRIVDDHISTQFFNKISVFATSGRGDEGSEVLGNLDGNGTNTARTGMDQNFIAFFNITLGDQRLPRSQASQRTEAACSWVMLAGLIASSSS